jgi:hypothetical protein
MKSNIVPLEELVNTMLLSSPGNIVRAQEILDKLVPKSARYHLEIRDDLQVVFHDDNRGVPDLRAFS